MINQIIVADNAGLDEAVKILNEMSKSCQVLIDKIQKSEWKEEESNFKQRVYNFSSVSEAKGFANLFGGNVKYEVKVVI